MTLTEASERFCIDEDKLRYYEQNGLFDCHRQADGSIDYCYEMSEYICLIKFLLSAGLDMDTLKKYLKCIENDDISNKEQIKILIKQRYILLDDIHEKQKILDKLDYIIYKCKNKK